MKLVHLLDALSPTDKLQMLDVVTNPVFRSVLKQSIVDMEQDMLNLSPMTDPHFALTYATKQIALDEAKLLLRTMEQMRSDLLPNDN